MLGSQLVECWRHLRTAQVTDFLLCLFAGSWTKWSQFGSGATLLHTVRAELVSSATMLLAWHALSTYNCAVCLLSVRCVLLLHRRHGYQHFCRHSP
jgi:hypothetical protein